MRKTSGNKLQPTLWRTCRVLANRSRLRMLQCLLMQGETTVVELAERLHMPRSLVSEYLRALNARGLLSVRRSGPYVHYRTLSDPTLPQAALLLGSLKRECLPSFPAHEIFKLATAFTHPRRVLIYRTLSVSGSTVHDLVAETQISFDAVRRHLHKLTDRGFVVREKFRYTRNLVSSPFARALSQLALSDQR